MADYYSNDISRKKRRRGGTRFSTKDLVKLLLDATMTVLMVVLLFFTITAIVCQYVSPEKSGLLSVVALGAPIIYLLDVVTMFYWVVRGRWYFTITMLFMVCVGAFYISKYYKLEVDRKYDVTYKESRFTKVMSYNVCEGRKSALLDYVLSHKPDILCLQEISTNTEHWNALTERYNSTNGKYPYSPNQILSKYKILRSGEIEGLHLMNGLWADLRIKNDTIRVVNIHLQSTAIKVEDTRFLESHKYLVDKERESKLRSIVSRLVENNRKRALQAKSVADFLAKSPYRVIVCGDFNDVPLSYTYHTISKGLDDSFSKMADGFAYTYNTRYKLLRIDNILLSPSIEVASYEVDNGVELSDHFPVITRLKFNTNNK